MYGVTFYIKGGILKLLTLTHLDDCSEMHHPQTIYSIFGKCWILMNVLPYWISKQHNRQGLLPVVLKSRFNGSDIYINNIILNSNVDYLYT